MPSWALWLKGREYDFTTLAAKTCKFKAVLPFAELLLPITLKGTLSPLTPKTPFSAARVGRGKRKNLALATIYSGYSSEVQQIPSLSAFNLGEDITYTRQMSSLTHKSKIKKQLPETICIVSAGKKTLQMAIKLEVLLLISKRYSECSQWKIPQLF